MNSKQNNKVVAGLVIAIVIVFSILGIGLASGTSTDTPKPTRTWYCPEGTQHWEDMDPMSGDAAAMRDQGVLVGTDGVGGSCVG